MPAICLSYVSGFNAQVERQQREAAQQRGS